MTTEILLKPGALHHASPRWPAGFPVLAGACQFGTALAGLRRNSFILSGPAEAEVHVEVRVDRFAGKNDLAICSQEYVRGRHINTRMSEVVKCAVAKMEASLSHVGMTVSTVSRLNEHVGDSADATGRWSAEGRRR